jgi:hypothetical protein
MQFTPLIYEQRFVQKLFFFDRSGAINQVSRNRISTSSLCGETVKVRTFKREIPLQRLGDEVIRLFSHLPDFNRLQTDNYG